MIKLQKLQNKNLKKLIIVNPASANGRTKKRWERLKDELIKKIGPFDFQYTTGQNTATIIATQAINNNYNAIISMGGDGTNNEVINGFFNKDQLLRDDLYFGIIPSGTGGDFPKTLFEVYSETSSINGILNNTFDQIDAGFVKYINHFNVEETRIFLNIAEFGFGGAVVDYVNNSTKLFGGFLSFFLAGLKTFAFYKSSVCKYKIDEESFENLDSFWTVIANGRYFGGGMKISPASIINDGFFDILIFKNYSKIMLLREISKIYKGKHLENKNIILRKCKKFSIETETNFFLDVDGEGPGKASATITLLPKSINLLV